MSDSIEFAHFLRFRETVLLTAKRNFFLAKPNLSLLCMHDFQFVRNVSHFREKALVESDRKNNPAALISLI
jgi:hypothetical protein